MAFQNEIPEPHVSHPPCYAVIFTSARAAGPDDGYGETATRMEELARQQPGFLGVESARGPDGVGITVSYWESAEAIAAWGRHAEHLLAQKAGRDRWYEWYTLRVCRVEQTRAFGCPPDPAPEPDLESGQSEE